MTPDDLRQAWNRFFEERDHTTYRSDSLVPENDPTLLFTGAGMNQFKDMFVGKGNLPFKRATTIQKCFRQGDLENVGQTPRHLTFFEMLGHFSFGDYFKAEAIGWAWEFLTKELGINPDKLWVSVYEDDDEAYEAWKAQGLPDERIARFDAGENFWPADAPTKGPNGPCGPCSEIFYDYGEARASGDGGPHAYDSTRFVEIWNTVFTQYDRRGENDLKELPQKNIDCGAGFERIMAVLEGQYSPFGTSLFRPIIEVVAKLADTPYDFEAGGGLPEGDDARRMRRIAEHARACCMLVADGVRPGNEGRDYILRRVMRRAIRDGIQLGMPKDFFAELVDPVIEVMGKAYPQLGEGRSVLRSTFQNEERRFRETYNTGLRYLEDEVEKLGDAKILPGAAAFRLYDTYGFPLDLAELILAERDITVDVAGYEREMEAQRERARAGSKIAKDIFAGGPLVELKAAGVEATTFLGYEESGRGVAGEAQVVGIISGEALVDAIEAGAEAAIVLDRTPFYAESGGQVGDAGTIASGDAVFEVVDTQKLEGYHVHRGRLTSGTIRKGDDVASHVDGQRRDAIRRNHTATHLMHKVLKDVLGEHVQQEGSLVDADRLRFDFRHDQALTDAEIAEIEQRVNRWIVRNEQVASEVMDIEAAKASGAVAMFGEKYDDTVRVLDVPGGQDGASRELCGGTHCAWTGEIGSFRVTMESSIAAGIRRIEAVTGGGAVVAFEQDRAVLQDLGRMLKTKPEALAERVRGLQDEVKALRKAAEKAAREAGLRQAGALADTAETVDGLKVVLASVPGVDAKGLRGVWDTLRKAGVGVAFLVGEAGDKAPLLAACDKAAVEAGKDAGQLVQAARGVLGGGGGGKAGMAQGMGLDRSKIDAALEAVRAAL
ncbi:MAG: alanine--tRNA ligase [Planctomycetota bacterium]|nr:alanine--tRNA ligase [Planctomycetota bacterium]